MLVNHKTVQLLSMILEYYYKFCQLAIVIRNNLDMSQLTETNQSGQNHQLLQKRHTCWMYVIMHTNSTHLYILKACICV